MPGIAPNTGRDEPLLQIATHKGETTVVEDAPGTENNLRAAFLSRLNLATGNKSIITPPVGIWLIDKHSPVRHFEPSWVVLKNQPFPSWRCYSKYTRAAEITSHFKRWIMELFHPHQGSSVWNDEIGWMTDCLCIYVPPLSTCGFENVIISLSDQIKFRTSVMYTQVHCSNALYVQIHTYLFGVFPAMWGTFLSSARNTICHHVYHI